MFEVASLNRHSRFSTAFAQRLSILILLLVVALMTTSCGMPAQAAGTQTTTPRILNLYGNLPHGAVNEPYNAVLAVGGGNVPYHFSVKTGSLPPGVNLNPATGAFSGKPSAAGKYSFEVIVTDSPRLDKGIQTFVVAIGGTVGGGGGGGVKVSVSPSSATLLSKQTQ